ncbi:hypothetical protein ABIE26_000768 [Pedobacter africanus]|uniref:Uncharacterized protein n=1 Tax=Pedobacter africanus TaxID=151894 RepID=A0ACC6KUC6_9SPHI|nr:hypothetical protein [Pedobacter africanus]
MTNIGRVLILAIGVNKDKISFALYSFTNVTIVSVT